MASLSTCGNSRWLIQFMDGVERKGFRVGPLGKKAAEEIRLHVERMLAAKKNNTFLEQATRDWLRGISRELLTRFHELGLVEMFETQTIGGFTLDLIDKMHRKPITLQRIRYARKLMLQHYSPTKPLNEFTPADADEYRYWLRKQGFSDNTVRRQCSYARQFFRAAVRRRLIEANPFADMKGLTVAANRSRDYFISAEEAEKVMDRLPSHWWRLLFSLARWGGLRIPSEAAVLAWSDVNWELQRIVIRSPKNEAHESGVRIIPIFPEIAPHLQAMFDRSQEFSKDDPASALVFFDMKLARRNLRTQLTKYIEAAGIKPWPKLWQNLRATRATELIALGFRQHVVTQWIGHTEAIARKHYWQVTDADYEKALQNVMQPPPKSVANHDATETAWL